MNHAQHIQLALAYIFLTVLLFGPAVLRYAIKRRGCDE